MSHIGWILAAPMNIGWQEIVLIFLIIAVLSLPGLIVLAIVLFVVRYERRKRAIPPPLPSAETQRR
jgi:hypothetical protein